MKIQVVGVNHKEAPLSVRERVAIAPPVLVDAYQSRDRIRHEEGTVVLSTCNRTEIYVAGDVELADVLTWWERMVGVNRGEFSDALYWWEGMEAARHLFGVAAGIDSMVLGETQILGQVKDAYQIAQEYGVAGQLHRIFQYALKVGKRSHSETEVGRNALSLGYAVVELAKKVFGTVQDRSALIIGAGETAQLVARHLSAQGLKSLTILNRTDRLGARLAQEIGVLTVDWAQLESAMARADIVVSCTSAPGFLVTREMAARTLKRNPHQFRFFFDLAVPRDIDPTVADLSRSVFVYDIDDVTRVVDANLQKRRREVFKVDRIIQEEVVQFQDEVGAGQVGSVIRSLRDKAETIRQEELAKAMVRLPNLSEDERRVVADTTRLILNKFLNDAMVSMRSWGQDEQKGSSYIAAIRELFRLTDEDAAAMTRDTHVALPGK